MPFKRNNPKIKRIAFTTVLFFIALICHPQARNNKTIRLVEIRKIYGIPSEIRFDKTEMRFGKGFDSQKNSIAIYLNDKRVCRYHDCIVDGAIEEIGCPTNNCSDIGYYIKYRQIKVGDKLLITYNDECAVYTIDKQFFYYPYMQISKIAINRWEVDFAGMERIDIEPDDKAK